LSPRPRFLLASGSGHGSGSASSSCTGQGSYVARRFSSTHRFSSTVRGCWPPGRASCWPLATARVWQRVQPLCKSHGLMLLVNSAVQSMHSAARGPGRPGCARPGFRHRAPSPCAAA
jgi:hypothetical protein